MLNVKPGDQYVVELGNVNSPVTVICTMVVAELGANDRRPLTYSEACEGIRSIGAYSTRLVSCRNTDYAVVGLSDRQVSRILSEITSQGLTIDLSAKQPSAAESMSRHQIAAKRFAEGFERLEAEAMERLYANTDLLDLLEASGGIRFRRDKTCPA